MELNCGSHMVLLSVTAVVVNKMQRSLSAHSPARGCVPSSASALSAVCVQGGPSVLLLLGSQLPGSFQGPPPPSSCTPRIPSLRESGGWKASTVGGSARALGRSHLVLEAGHQAAPGWKE